MLDQLYRNLAAPFTRWAVQTGALRSPFVIVDVGVRGGVNTRWEALGDALELYGFDLDQHAIAALSSSRNRKYFACNIVGADLETSFNVSATLPNTHFWESYEPLLHQRLLLDDIAFDRLPRPSFAERVARALHGVAPRGVYRPATCNIFLARNLVAERSNPDAYRFRGAELVPSADTLLKAAITFEVHGLNDLAFDLFGEFQNVLAPTLDVDRARDLIAPKLSRWRAAQNCLYTPHMGLVTAARILFRCG